MTSFLFMSRFMPACFLLVQDIRVSLLWCTTVCWRVTLESVGSRLFLRSPSSSSKTRIAMQCWHWWDESQH